MSSGVHQPQEGETRHLEAEVCRTCHGRGVVSYGEWARIHEDPEEELHPADEHREQPCPDCGGGGYIYER